MNEILISLQERLHKFFDFVSRHGEEKTYEWILTGVIFSGCITLAYKFLYRAKNSYTTFLERRQQFRQYIGRYFMFHTAISNIEETHPRLSRLIISQTLLGGGKVLQKNIHPDKKMHIGKPTASYSLLFSIFTPWDSAIKTGMDPRFKSLLILPFKASPVAGTRISIGVMSGVNLRGEPWRASILLSDKLISSHIVAEILNSLDQTTLTHELLDRTAKLAEAGMEAESYGHFNFPWGTTTYIRSEIHP